MEISKLPVKSSTLIALLAIVFSLYLWKQIIADQYRFFVHPQTITIKAENGKYLTADRSKQNGIYASKESPGSREEFRIKRYNSTVVAFSGKDHRWISINDQDQVAADQKKPGRNSFFILVPQTGDLVHVKDVRNRYLTLEENNRIGLGDQSVATTFRITSYQIRFPVMEKGYLMLAFLGFFLSLFFIQVTAMERYAIIPLIIGAFFYRLYNITIHDFLFLWDEQFHAVVARNMITHPFKPMYLPHPILPYDPVNWVGNHVWLHKQPLFLWQIAVFIHLFGNTAWAVRVPDLIMTTLLVPVIYRMGFLLWNRRTGILASMMFTGSYFLFTLVSGAQFTDHNDVSFVCYVTLSLWSWLEYVKSSSVRRRFFFLILTGVFAGCAVLVKWLVGLVVFSGWMVYILIQREKRKNWKNYFQLSFSLVVCLVVFLPWQLYILNMFPQESIYEYQQGTNHFFQAIEGHSGNGHGWLYDLKTFSREYGLKLFYWIIALIFFTVLSKKRDLTVAFSSYFVIVFLFFGIAATKMPAFTFISVSVIYIIFAAFLDSISIFLKKIISSHWIRLFLVNSLILFVLSNIFQLSTLYQENYFWKKNPDSCLYQRNFFSGLIQHFDKQIPADDQSRLILINCPWEEVGEMLFYTNLRAVYSQIDSYQLAILKEQQGCLIGYLKIEGMAVPDFIRADSTIQIIEFEKPVTIHDFTKCTR